MPIHRRPRIDTARDVPCVFVEEGGRGGVGVESEVFFEGDEVQFAVDEFEGAQAEGWRI